ncbi:hypothetical protein [Dethiosulfovibrio salsuginis]|uniref:Uncharacterized protein n=1 Tax=Dethiosulfovibrio salsuginis TaxID=561720 RepID=A0A1X7JXG5_9BACT|nr:hypothetical protein [Dethiosulfovibrio salsuginis]SMG33076.1 hypothetical protein SAMN06275492_1189 [Dethiosulfovibrio salsuginis]
MGKLISPDPDMWGNPVRRGAVEDKLKDRQDIARYDRKRYLLTVAVVSILLSPFVVIALKMLSN